MKERKKLTHKELTRHARCWLVRAKKCNPAFSEKGSAIVKEMPDVIGWDSHTCYVVECKTTRSDLLADIKKPFRIVGGMGNERYYFISNELYQLCKDFNYDGWGIVTYGEFGVGRQERLRASKKFESNITNERNYLRSRILEIQRFGRI